MRGSGRSVWDDLATPEELAALDPRVPTELKATPDVLGVGGGVRGLAAAVECCRAGMNVLVVERGRLAEGASGRAAGGLSPDVHPELGEDWHALARSSLALHHELDVELGFGLRSRDVLVAPDLRIPDQAHADPVKLASALAGEAGTISTRTECTYTLTSGGRIVTVVTTAGRVHPGAVVFATGLPPPQAPSVPRRLVRGHLIATEPASFVLDELVTDGDILVVQLANGMLVAGGTKDYEEDAEEIDVEIVSDIERRMVELVPESKGLSRTHEWCCFRPCVSDDLPVVDRVPGLSNAWMAAGFYSTGLLMAPIVGRLLASWLSGDRPQAFAPFGIDRERT